MPINRAGIFRKRLGVLGQTKKIPDNSDCCSSSLNHPFYGGQWKMFSIFFLFITVKRIYGNVFNFTRVFLDLLMILKHVELVFSI